MLRLLRAEALKLKHSTAAYLLPAILLLVLGIVFLAHSLDVHRLSLMDNDPWPRYLKTTLTTYAMLVVSPLCLLLVAAVLYVEQRADAWKQLYALPVARGRIYQSKLVLILGLLVLTTLLYCLGVLGIGWVLNILFPEYELAYFQPNYTYLFATAGSIVLSTLGIVGIQYVLGLLFRGLIPALGIGFFGLIAGFILSTTETVIPRYFPYAFPLIAQDFGVANPIHQEAVMFGMNTGIVGSIICFLVCVVFGYWWEGRRQVV
ncbi:MAG: ABC transporter permease [Bacteroidota bacterium]